MKQRYPWMRWVEASGAELLTPHLWGIGMREARGDVVAITTSHFVPASTWLAVIKDRFSRLEAAGIGGRIDPPSSSNLVDWATYFQRYSAYLEMSGEQEVRDIAGDNAAYRRSDLLRHPQFFQEGFWEPDFHKLVLKEGKRLVFVPEMVVRMQNSFGFWPFIGQRFHHAIQFGQARMRGKGLGVRLLGVCALPLIPPLFMTKILMRVWRGRRYRGAFFASLPVLGCFLTAWALGEVLGYVEGND